MDIDAKPKSKRARRILERREPKLEENTKNAIFVRGSKCTGVISRALSDLYALKKPDALNLKDKNRNRVVRPFEQVQSLEYLSAKNDASLFAFGSQSKKRPNTLILGRMYEHHLLDMFECGIEPGLRSIAECTKHVEPAALGHKPAFVFIGDEFERNDDLKRAANLIVDFFRGTVVDRISLAGLEHVIAVTASGTKMFFRVYRIQLKKSGSRLPRVELAEMGPSFDMTLRRTRWATSELMREACRVPQAVKISKTKNIEKSALGVRGRIHMPRQQLSQLALKRPAALKRARTSDNAAPASVAKRSKQSLAE